MKGNLKFIFEKKIIFALVLILFFNQLVIGAEKGGILVDDSKNLEKVNSEIKNGNFNNLITTLDKTFVGHISILFEGVDNSHLIDAWNKLEIKKNDGIIDITKTNSYRQMFLSGVSDGKNRLDLFVGSLIAKNSNLKNFEFIGIENSKETVVNGDFIDLKDSSGKIHKIPLKDLGGVKKVVFSEIEGGGSGYAVQYFFEKGTDNSAFLSSGHLKYDGKSYEVFDLISNEIKSIGKVSFRDNSIGAIYFRGVPNEISNNKFGFGDYVFSKSGKEGDIIFEDNFGTLIASNRDISNNEGLKVGYQSEIGTRGVKQLDTNNDKKLDLTIDIINQNGVGIKRGENSISPQANKFIEIRKSDKDILASFSSGINNVQIINLEGNVKSGSGTQEFSSGINQPMKIINGVVEGLFVERQNIGSELDRINLGNIQVAPPLKDPSIPTNPIIPIDKITQNNGLQIDNNFISFSNQLTNKDSKTPIIQNKGMDAFSAATYNSVNRVRGNALSSDLEMNKRATAYSKLMASRYRLVHSGTPGYGENIAYFSGSKDMSPEQVGREFARIWKNSPGHLRNIVNPNYKKTGMGIYYDGGLWWGTQMFSRNA